MHSGSHGNAVIKSDYNEKTVAQLICQDLALTGWFGPWASYFYRFILSGVCHQ